MILVHTCCADCSLKMTDAVSRDPARSGEAVKLYFYNPNIHPQNEWTARLTALQQVAASHGIAMAAENWTPRDYFSGLAQLPPGTKPDRSIRCPRCWTVRLQRTFAYAAAAGTYSAVTTTMVTSRYMDRDRITAIGTALGKQYGIPFYVPPVCDCQPETRGFYKQNYCGCVWSLVERMTEKYGVSGADGTGKADE